MAAKVFFVSPDPSRATGLALVIPNLVLITEKRNSLVDTLMTIGVECHVTGTRYNNTGSILADDSVAKFIESTSSESKPNILVFKPSAKIDLLAAEYGYTLLANNSGLNKKFEDKINFYKMCKECDLPVPAGLIDSLDKVSFSQIRSRVGIPFVVQFGRGWAGNTTFIITNEADFMALVKKYSGRLVKITRKIDGVSVLTNACVASNGKTFVSDPAYQIPGSQFGSLDTITFGRQWGIELFSQVLTQKLTELTMQVGSLMARSGYLGWFGLDFLVDKRGRVYISENNARLTASFSFFTQLELRAKSSSTLLAQHVDAFLGMGKTNWIKTEVEGAQVSLRTNTHSPTAICQSKPSGIYSNSLNYLRAGSGVVDIQQPDELFVDFPASGDVLGGNSEFITIETIAKIVTNGNQVTPEMKKSVAGLSNFVNYD